MHTGLRELGDAEVGMTELEEIESLELSTADWIWLAGVVLTYIVYSRS